MNGVAQSRDPTVDSTKGLAILLVVWGHCIQHISPGPGFGYYEDPAFKAIYSFHMPLFMAVSGYLFGGSESKYSTSILLKKRLQRLLVPVIVWSLLTYAVTNILLFEAGRPMAYPLQNPLWFLTALLACSCGAILCRSVGKGHWLIFVVAIPLSLLLPDSFGLMYDKFMLPYFFAGILFFRYSSRIPQIGYRLSAGLSLVAFAVLVRYWNSDCYVYTTHMSLYVPCKRYQILILGYRFLAGFAGTITAVSAIHRAQPFISFKPLKFLGRSSMGIYVLTQPLMPHLQQLGIRHRSLIFYDLLLTPLAASLLCVLAGWLARGLELNRWTSLLFLGAGGPATG